MVSSPVPESIYSVLEVHWQVCAACGLQRLVVTRSCGGKARFLQMCRQADLEAKQQN
jgi:hypothetical protein